MVGIAYDKRYTVEILTIQFFLVKTAFCVTLNHSHLLHLSNESGFISLEVQRRQDLLQDIIPDNYVLLAVHAF